ncbi:hypothetical protein [Pseudomonas amygdali]|uniref:Uncharacterized protein n=1 Tax=Pseudomonas amygdali pv. lachrymans str. M301315 TaxID=629260 RepID=A0AAD0PVT8_PSEAV|nr:hypothetical protein [Pseudomonas amygdali]AXH59689.1 hypothetical protein PLA107_031190 [Pseudomonas amygdali pv. lachrymans str. M301315]RMT06472.1 hypothetical protein ALP54_03597 [Pseudomonas amygdali pv. lachrymans]
MKTTLPFIDKSQLETRTTIGVPIVDPKGDSDLIERIRSMVAESKRDQVQLLTLLSAAQHEALP